MSESTEIFAKDTVSDLQQNVSEQTCCGEGVNRRSFLRMMGAGSLALGTTLPVMAGPFAPNDFDVNLPADKRLNPEWVKALFERGTPELFRGDQLKNIGMPAGGVGAGHVYLSGEGRLTDWRIDARKASAGGGSIPFKIQQGFCLQTLSAGKTEMRQLNQAGFPATTFRGEYPIAMVEYADPACPIATSLEAFSPFIPLDDERSGFPATIFHFTLKNTTAAPVQATLLGGLENGIAQFNRFSVPGNRRNQITQTPTLSVLNCTAEPTVDGPGTSRPDVVFEDWSKPTFDGWHVEGEAFGKGPIARTKYPKKDIGGEGTGIATTFADPAIKPEPKPTTGRLTSASFKITRRYINVWLGGADLPDKSYVRLYVDGKPVETQQGWRENRLSIHTFDVRAFEGKQAQLEITDNSAAARGNVAVGRISFSDTPGDGTTLEKLPDYGSMALALIGPSDAGSANSPLWLTDSTAKDASVPLAQTLTGTLGRHFELLPGESAQLTFIVSWYFPNLEMKTLGHVGRFYATKFTSAQNVAEHVAEHLHTLTADTRLWRDTWYDSTLPIWFLDRTLLNVSTLATSGCYRFADGRFYAWEGGPDCCPGTCTHVWQYAHSMSRIFPALERDTRERVDLNIALHPDTGVMGFRAEFDTKLAVDGQAGTILRIYREHQMAPDAAFLQRNWPNIKKVYDPLFALDADQDGIMEGAQMNTLDRPWFGQISWMSSMYVAALRAGEAMAREMHDTAFEDKCRTIATRGTASITKRLYNGEYFINLVDPTKLDTVNSGTGSHIDQVYGQSWAFQVGLPRVLPEKETRSALRALWKYNFTPDAGAYFAAHKAGRKFVSIGDAGMIICTFPHPDWDYVKASGGGAGGFAYYFNEVWTGNEYQVVTHMFWEGMLLEPMAMVRAIHDRYNPSKRNPFSEYECGSHYARAMASHGAFLGICGFEHHGPEQHIGFAPKLTPQNFRAPFTASQGWGTYVQTLDHKAITASIDLKSGTLNLRTIALTHPGTHGKPHVKAMLGDTRLTASATALDGRITVTFSSPITVKPGTKLALALG